MIDSPQTTGKYLVLLREDDLGAGIQALQDLTGISRVAMSRDFAEGAVTPDQLEEADTVIFEQLGVAVVSLDPEQLQSLNVVGVRSTEGSPFLGIEPERIVYALTDDDISIPPEYLRGYRDGVVRLVDHLLSPKLSMSGTSQKAIAAAETAATWGLQVTQVLDSQFSGMGVKVAVLDTGLDLTHPDFAGRKITSKSFISNEEVQDKNGHGTHCIGTACGGKNPAILPRYGVAYNAEIFAGKVLSNRGSGSDQGILAGIQWAITSGCRIVSMSLGAPTVVGQRPSFIFEQVAQRSLRRGTLIVAAAGNESRRDLGRIKPVGHPANCPSIMAVAALDAQMRLAYFSNRELNPEGGQVDIAGPGVSVYSTWPMPRRYNTISGTSMATPHVAGIAALYAEANPTATAQGLWSLLIRNARRLTLPSTDVGSGLIQAP